MYDSQNIFARILRKELPSKIILETSFALAFYDLHPKAPVHALVIPKGAFKNAFDFHEKASPEEIVGFYQAVNETIEKLKLTSFRLLSNSGKEAGQIVDHFHIHILGGKSLKEAP